MDTLATQPQQKPVFLSRNPIFSSTRNVWGYELQTDQRTDDPDGIIRADIGEAVLGGDYVGLNSIISRNKFVLLRYSREQLLNRSPHAFPAKSSVILLSRDLQMDASLAALLESYVQDGHTLAMEWCTECSPGADSWKSAEIIVFDSDAGADVLKSVLVQGKICLIRNVASQDDFERMEVLGVQLFQGSFFKTPEIIPGRKLTVLQSSRLQLLRLIETDDPNLDALAQIIQTDVSLSYRLLVYLNSPTFGLMRKVESIRQAIALLGWINLRNWLRAMLLIELSQGEHQIELLHVSLHRGKFLELLVRNFDYWDFKPDEMFLVGLFSLLDAILGIPMAEALELLPLSEMQKKALSGENCEYSPLLSLLYSLENLGSVTAQSLAAIGLKTDEVFMRYYEASAWAAATVDTVSPVK